MTKDCSLTSSMDCKSNFQSVSALGVDLLNDALVIKE